MISSTLVCFASTLDDSNVAVEAPTPGFGEDGFLPFAKKHVVIKNVVANGQVLNVHCKSSENDLGTIQIPWGKSWDFNFRVNLSASTKFRCYFTWKGGGSHYFTIFSVWRDDNPFGDVPVCKECIWEVGLKDRKPMCRYRRDGKGSYCFDWDDNF